jgi:phosphate uptake regulator
LKHFERIADHSTNIAESVFLWSMRRPSSTKSFQ